MVRDPAAVWSLAGVLRRLVSERADHEVFVCGERLAYYNCPTSVDFIDELPRNPSGKVTKKELRETYRASVAHGSS